MSVSYPYGKSTNKSELPSKTLTPEQVAITEAAVGLAQEELANVRRQAEISKYLASQFPEAYRAAAESGALDETNFLDRIDAVRGNISTYAENALRLGEEDISRQTRLGLEGVRDVLAPDRGLRPGDSPILGLGSDIVREGLFQQGQLTRAVRGQEAAQLAQFDQDATQFQAMLAQNAFQNRLSLAGFGAEGTLGFSASSPLSSQVYQGLVTQRLAQPHQKGVGLGGQGGGGGASFNYFGSSS